MKWKGIDKLQTTTLFDIDACNTNKPTRKMHLLNSALSAATSFSGSNRAAIENHWPLCVANMPFLGKSTATPTCMDTPWWCPRSPAMSTWRHRKQLSLLCICLQQDYGIFEPTYKISQCTNAITGTSKLSRTYCTNHPQQIFSVGRYFRQHVKTGLKADFSHAPLRRLLNWSIASIAN